jgi:hypothetical protein
MRPASRRDGTVWLAVDEHPPNGATVRVFDTLAGAVDCARGFIVAEVDPEAYPGRVRRLVDQVEENAVGLAAEGVYDECEPVEYADGCRVSVREAKVKGRE